MEEKKTSILKSPLLNSDRNPNPKLSRSWEWKMLKPKMPELPKVKFSRTEDNLVRATFLYKGEEKYVDFQPEKFFKQTVKVIREIKSLMD